MYYGSHKISEVKDVEDHFKLIMFEPEEDENGELKHVQPDITSPQMLEACQSEDPTDANELHRRRMEVFKNDLTSILVMHNAYLEEFPAALQAANQLVIDTFTNADEVAWGEPQHRKSLHLCNKFLKERG